MDTYRYHGHSMSDPGITYRNRDEVAGVRKTRDPVERVKRYLEEFELATAAEIKEIERAVRREIDEAVEAAKAAPPPLYRHLIEPSIYAGLQRDEDIDKAVRLCDSTLPPPRTRDTGQRRARAR